MAFDRKHSVDETASGKTTAMEVFNRVTGFFDWAGYGDCRKIFAWQTWAAAQVGNGRGLESVMDELKAKWVHHRRSLGLDVRIEMTTSHECVNAMTRSVVDLVGSGLTPEGAAIVFRSIARQFPNERAPKLVVAHCERINNWSDEERGAEAW
jgi:hypothetical protein